MKEITLKKLKMSNFKAQTRVVEFGKKTNIYGCNGAGKTTIIKAWLWLLTGETDPLNGANHELFDNRVPLSEHTPEASVCATVEIDGTEITLERTAKAKFERKRGSVEYTKASSDEYKYFIDNVKCSASMWTKWIEDNICNQSVLKYCLSGDFFTVLAEEDRAQARKVIEAIVGSPDESQMKGDYSSISEDLKRFSIEDLKQRYRNMKSPFENEAKTFPALIQDKMNKIDQERMTHGQDTDKEIAEAKARIEEIDNILLASPIDHPERLEALKKVEAVKKEIEEAREAHYQNAANAKRESEMRKRELDSLRDDLAALDSMDKNAKLRIDSMQSDVEDITKKLNIAKERKFNDEEAVCEYCGQPLPPSMLEERKEKYLEAKKKEIDGLKKLGEGLAEQIMEIEAGVMEREAKRDEKEKEIARKEKEYESYSAVASTYGTEFEESTAYAELKEKLDSIVVPELERPDLSKYSEEKKALMEKLEGLFQKAADAESSKKKVSELEKDIDELRKKQREYGNEIAKCENLIITLQKYESERAEMLADMVNKHLDGCNIQMFEIQKNGERKESCTVHDDRGVKYATLNNSARLLVNIQIQKMFDELNGVKLPVFCDECSVYDSQHIPSGDGQYIYIHCSDDTSLKFEKTEK